ncbi:MAG: diphthine synthase [Halobacteriales archaeon]
MLRFVGLGLYDDLDVTLRGARAIERADVVYAEFYTSRLSGCTLEDLERRHGSEIRVLERDEVESSSEVVDRARRSDVVFAVAGDPMVSTTHAELRLRAMEAGVETTVVNAPSVSSAVSSATGLQNYRFGRSTSLVGRGGWTPSSPFEVVRDNLERRLHTLVYLDIDVDGDRERYMKASEAAARFDETDAVDVDTVVGVARVGSPDVDVAYGTPAEVAEVDLGEPLHVVVAPAELHDVERRYLEAMAKR